MQKDLKEGLISEFKPIREGMKNLKSVTFPQYPSITAHDDDGQEEVIVFIRDAAEQYLRKFASVSGTDKKCELRDKDGKFILGRRKQKLRKTIAGDKEYARTPGVWEHILATTADDKIFINGDYDNYAEIVHSTNALRRNNDENETKPNANKIWR